MNTSASGGVLLPAQAAPSDDDLLNSIFQSLFVAVTGLDGQYVRERWQAVEPKQPASTVNWCAFGVSVDDGDCPFIDYDPDTGITTYTIQSQVTVLATFYGPASRQYVRQLRDGLRIPQNTEGLLTNQIRFCGSGPIRAMPEYVNTGWIRRHDIQMRFGYEVVRTYPIESLNVAIVNLTAASINDTIIVPPGTPVEP